MDKQFWTAAELVERGVYAIGPARPTMEEAIATLDAGVRLSMGIVRHEHALIPTAIPGRFPANLPRYNGPIAAFLAGGPVGDPLGER